MITEVTNFGHGEIEIRIRLTLAEIAAASYPTTIGGPVTRPDPKPDDDGTAPKNLEHDAPGNKLGDGTTPGKVKPEEEEDEDAEDQD